jgi:transcriptional pleiotropic regulator of transition state genes
MKSTGIVRKLDNLGRIVVPIELRKILGIEIRDSIEIYTEGDQIILRKYAPGCVFCGEAKDIVIQRSGKMICRKCAVYIATGGGANGSE